MATRVTDNSAVRRVGPLVGLSPNAAAGVVAASYLVLAGIYIFVSSTWLGSLGADAKWQSEVEVVKGFGFVALTGLLLFVAVRRQMSRVQRAHRTLATTAERLAHADKRASVSVLSATTAHEMKNIITVLQAAHSMIRKPSGREGPRAEQMLDDMDKALERLRGLARDLMRQAGPEPGATELIVLPALLEDVARLARMLRRERPFEISVRASKPVKVEANRQDLEHVFRNLLLNAFEAGASSVVLEVSETAERVRVRVSDDGPGVPEPLRDSLFEPFVTHKEGGTGLGLAVVRDLVRRHNGRIQLEPQPTTGASFVVELPKAEDPQRASNTPPSAEVLPL